MYTYSRMCVYKHAYRVGEGRGDHIVLTVHIIIILHTRTNTHTSVRACTRAHAYIYMCI